jgi:hypothetical protein
LSSATETGAWTQTYDYTPANLNNTTTPHTEVKCTQGALTLLDQNHWFKPFGRDIYDHGGIVDGSGYTLWPTGLEKRTETMNGSSVLLATESDWTQMAMLNWSSFSSYTQYQPENNNRINESRRFLDDGSMSKVDTFYDQFNNPTEVKEFDFAATSPTRDTVTSYMGSPYTNDSPHLVRLPFRPYNY